MKRFFMFAAMIMAFSAVGAMAQNGSTVTRWGGCDYYIYNPCCSELIQFCLDVQVVADKDGNWKSGSAKGSGISDAGTKYMFADNTHWDSKWKPVGANQYTYMSRMRMVATGNSSCTFTVTFHWLVTVNANGDVTATIDKYEVECGGESIL